jgi:hypothetical protein
VATAVLVVVVHNPAVPVVAGAADLTRLLQTGDRIDRSRVYQQFGLTLGYEKIAATGRELVHARSQLCRGGGLILALTTTESVTVPISAVLWLDDKPAT